MLNVSKTKIMLMAAVTHQKLDAVDSFLVAADNTSLEKMDTLNILV